jgi:hypothetical protein
MGVGVEGGGTRFLFTCMRFAPNWTNRDNRERNFGANTHVRWNRVDRKTVKPSTREIRSS